MTRYIISRDDEQDDFLTFQFFETYEDAYDVLEEYYESLGAEEADDEDRPYYEIVEVSETS